MKDKQFEQLFKDALGKYEAPYDASNWSAMEKMLDDKPNNYLFLKAGEIALVCAAVWFIANPFIQSNFNENKSGSDVAIVSEIDSFEESNSPNEEIATIEENTINNENSISNNYNDELTNEVNKTDLVETQISSTNLNTTNQIISANTNMDISEKSEDLQQTKNTINTSVKHSIPSSQYEKDMLDFKTHLANNDMYALNVAFNINGETYSEQKKAWIIADINERSARSLSRLSELEVIATDLTGSMDEIQKLEDSNLKSRPLAFLDQMNQNMIYGIEYSPDIQTNNFSSNYQTGNTFGFNMKYEVNEKIRLVTGAHYYSFKMENPGFCMSAVDGFTGEVSVNNDQGVSNQALTGPQSISASDCFSHSQHFKRQIEIPFEADIQLNNFGNFSMFLNSGISMYLINREYFDYHLVDNDIQLRG